MCGMCRLGSRYEKPGTSANRLVVNRQWASCHTSMRWSSVSPAAPRQMMQSERVSAIVYPLIADTALDAGYSARSSAIAARSGRRSLESAHGGGPHPDGGRWPTLLEER